MNWVVSRTHNIQQHCKTIAKRFIFVYKLEKQNGTIFFGVSMRGASLEKCVAQREVCRSMEVSLVRSVFLPLQIFTGTNVAAFLILIAIYSSGMSGCVFVIRKRFLKSLRS